MRSFDLLSGPNKQIAKQTWLGGILSLVAFVVLLVLLRTEHLNWSDKRLTKTIFVDNVTQMDSVLVSLALYFPNCPCALISLDVHDNLQHHRENIPMEKFRIPDSDHARAERVASPVRRGRHHLPTTHRTSQGRPGEGRRVSRPRLI